MCALCVWKASRLFFVLWLFHCSEMVVFMDSFKANPILVWRNARLVVWITGKTTEATKKQLSFYPLFK
jgi:hypothetical protein